MMSCTLNAVTVAEAVIDRLNARLSRIKLSDVTDVILQILRPDLARRGDELLIEVGDSDRFLEGDLSRVAQVMADLLDSASYVSTSRLTVRVAIERDCLIMHARESGPGLGLPLACQLTETYGNEISCCVSGSAAGSEIIVRVHLPVSEAEDVTDGDSVWFAVGSRGGVTRLRVAGP